MIIHWGSFKTSERALFGAAGLRGVNQANLASVLPAANISAVHGMYRMTWVQAQTRYLVGVNGPLSWQLSRVDGVAVDVPLFSTIGIYGQDDVSLDTLTAHIQPTSPMQLAQVYAFPEPGYYSARIQASMPDGVIVGADVYLVAV